MVVDLVVPDSDVELAVDALLVRGATAVAERAAARPGHTVLTAELPDDADLDGLGHPASRHRPEPVLAPPARRVAIGPVVVHHPDDPVAPAPGRVPVPIDPGAAFGHGDHPTTRLALRAVVARSGPGTDVLDVGCGSGVLAVVAAVLGSRVRAVDLDPAAVGATAVNATRNGVGHLLAVDGTPVDELTEPADVVVANLLLAEHRPLAPLLPRLVRPGGHLVVSGLLVAQLDDLLAILPPWPAARSRDGTWAAAELRRPGPATHRSDRVCGGRTA